jgi:hypothetical protein
VKKLLALAALLIGCNADIDEQWELDHDRIIAIRAEPPRIEAGETSVIEMLLGYEVMSVEVKKPDFAQVVAPASLASALSFDGARWIVTAPSEETLAAVRAELGLEPDAPVPLQIGVAVAWPTPVMSPEGMNGFAGTKTVWLGQEGLNPPMNGLVIGDVEAPPEGTEIVFPKQVGSASPPKTWLVVEADAQRDIINWLSSCGTVHDFDLPRAYVTVDDEDRTEGQLALVLRDELGGVTWRVWPCRAE